MDIKIIGEGNTAEVYSWKEGQILKLFRKEFPLDGIEKEFRINKDIERLGLPIPKAEEIIEYNGRTGIVYERVFGESMLKLIAIKPWRARQLVKHLVDLQYEMHQCKAENLSSYKEALEWNINHTNALTDDVKRTILQILDQLPEGDFLCHGDFHPGNVIRTKENYVLLDWMTAASGVPSMDVARTVLLIKDSALPGDIPIIVKAIIGSMRARMLKNYLRYYKKRSGLTQAEIDRWRLPMIAARLTEWIPDTEQKALMKEIEETLLKGGI